MAVLALGVGSSCGPDVGETVIEKWPEGRRAAVSITYDGGTVNQFDVALPLMNELGLPGTFFVVTGDIRGSRYHRTYIGRAVDSVLAEVVRGVPTTPDNFFERAGAVRMLPYLESVEFHTRAGDLFELGRTNEAYEEVERGFLEAASGRLAPWPGGVLPQNPDVKASWEDLRAYAGQGHEIASHSVSHAQLATLDDANLRFELEKSREEIREHLGSRHTFSIEAPYGTENSRVMEQMLAMYPASRNRMPHRYLDEINRWSDDDPAHSSKEYVQWQRGPKSATPLDTMKSWIDRIARRDNVWLVLVFHGVEGIGWEPKPVAELEDYFGYVAGREDLWVAPFGDVTRYMRERMAATVSSESSHDEIRVELSHTLDPDIYDYPLTLRTPVPSSWKAVTVQQGTARDTVSVIRDRGLTFARYDAVPNRDVIRLKSSPDAVSR